MSVQEAAAASQKFTCPSVSAVAPACTAAVNVTTVPPGTEDTASPPEVMERVVVVAWDAMTGCDPPHQAKQMIANAQPNECSQARTFSPATVRKERMPTNSRLKQVFFLHALTEHVQVLFLRCNAPLSFGEEV
jgi:hypothetical protein